MSTTVEAPARAATPKLPALVAGGRVQAIVPHDFESAWRIASAVVAAKMAPPSLDTAEKAMVAIMHGLEVGLTPMNALQSIAVINGRATLWGDGALAVVRASGALEWIEETTEGTVAICRAKRVGEPKVIERRFSDEDAKAAGLLGKAGPWQSYKGRMRQMRARGFALRDGFADVLRGLGIAEEVQDTAATITPPSPPSPPSPPAAESVDVEFKEVATEGEEVEPLDVEKFLTGLENALAGAKTESDLIEAWDAEDVEAKLTHDEAALQRAFDMKKARLEAINLPPATKAAQRALKAG